MQDSRAHENGPRQRRASKDVDDSQAVKALRRELIEMEKLSETVNAQIRSGKTQSFSSAQVASLMERVRLLSEQRPGASANAVGSFTTAHRQFLQGLSNRIQVVDARLKEVSTPSAPLSRLSQEIGETHLRLTGVATELKQTRQALSLIRSIRQMAVELYAAEDLIHRSVEESAEKLMLLSARVDTLLSRFPQHATELQQSRTLVTFREYLESRLKRLGNALRDSSYSAVRLIFAHESPPGSDAKLALPASRVVRGHNSGPGLFTVAVSPLSAMTLQKQKQKQIRVSPDRPIAQHVNYTESRDSSDSEPCSSPTPTVQPVASLVISLLLSGSTFSAMRTIGVSNDAVEHISGVLRDFFFVLISGRRGKATQTNKTIKSLYQSQARRSDSGSNDDDDGDDDGDGDDEEENDGELLSIDMCEMRKEALPSGDKKSELVFQLLHSTSLSDSGSDQPQERSDSKKNRGKGYRASLPFGAGAAQRRANVIAALDCIEDVLRSVVTSVYAPAGHSAQSRGSSSSFAQALGQNLWPRLHRLIVRRLLVPCMPRTVTGVKNFAPIEERVKAFEQRMIDLGLASPQSMGVETGVLAPARSPSPTGSAVGDGFAAPTRRRARSADRSLTSRLDSTNPNIPLHPQLSPSAIQQRKWPSDETDDADSRAQRQLQYQEQDNGGTALMLLQPQERRSPPVAQEMSLVWWCSNIEVHFSVNKRQMVLMRTRALILNDTHSLWKAFRNRADIEVGRDGTRVNRTERKKMVRRPMRIRTRGTSWGVGDFNKALNKAAAAGAGGASGASHSNSDLQSHGLTKSRSDMFFMHAGGPNAVPDSFAELDQDAVPAELHHMLTWRYMRRVEGDISESVFELMKMLHCVMYEACLPSCGQDSAIVLYNAVRDSIYTYMAIYPSYWGKELTSVPQIAMLLNNDCAYIADMLTGLQSLYLFPNRSRFTSDAMLVDFVVPLRSLGRQYFVAQVTSQREELGRILGEAKRALQLTDGIMKSVETLERSVRQGLHTLDRQRVVWEGVFSPPLLLHFMTLSTQMLVGQLLDMVLAKEDVGGNLATGIYNSLSLVAESPSLLRFFNTPLVSASDFKSSPVSDDDRKSDVEQQQGEEQKIWTQIPSWRRLLAVRDIVAPDMNLTMLQERFLSGTYDCMPLSDLERIVCACWDPSDKRKNTLSMFKSVRAQQEQERTMLPEFITD